MHRLKTITSHLNPDANLPVAASPVASPSVLTRLGNAQVRLRGHHFLAECKEASR